MNPVHVNPEREAAAPWRRSVLFALAFLATAVIIMLLGSRYLEAGQRILGVMAGMLVMYYANAVPKALKPLAKLKNPARHESLQRFVGWSLLLGGLGYTLAFAFAPFNYMNPIGMMLLGGSLAIAIGRCFWIRRSA